MIWIIKYLGVPKFDDLLPLLFSFRPYDASKPSKKEFDSGLTMTSSPMTTTAPATIPESSGPIFTTATSTPDSSLPPTKVKYDENLEQEFHSMNYLTTDAPVDVDEALQNDNQSSNQWATTENVEVQNLV